MTGLAGVRVFARAGPTAGAGLSVAMVSGVTDGGPILMDVVVKARGTDIDVDVATTGAVRVAAGCAGITVASPTGCDAPPRPRSTCVALPARRSAGDCVGNP